MVVVVAVVVWAANEYADREISLFWIEGRS
jgi:hypothetical protein